MIDSGPASTVTVTAVPTGNTDNHAADTVAAPIIGKARIASLDTLRGVALFGILLMNIIAFANPFAAYLDPRVDAATSGLNLLTFATVDILFEGSMRTIFSMLFGAGMLVFLSKPGADAGKVRRLYYRRTGLLICFGLFNAYVLVWAGDILYAYGMAGLVLYLFRDFPVRRLLQCSAAILLFLGVVHSGMHMQSRILGNAVAEIEALPAGTVLSAEQQETLADWQIYLQQQFMTPELIAEESATKQAGYGEVFVATAATNVFIQTLGLVVNSFWDALAMMLLGMVLFKTHWLDASRPLRHYALLAMAGFAVGLPLNAWETITFIQSDYQLHWNPFQRPTYDIGRLSLALGYIGLVMMLCKSTVFTMLKFGLARVGQMALSNYLSQSLICNVLFLGFGFGLAGELQRYQLYLVVLAVWTLQFGFSVFWLQHYRFGPVEWLWRSLTYKRRQPMRLS